MRHGLDAAELGDGPLPPSVSTTTACGRRRQRCDAWCFCSGKIHVDLATSEARKDNQSVALTRVEQLYPFPADQIRAAFDGYPKLREVCWVQEEPENMGAWEFVRPLLEQLIDGRWPLRYGRPEVRHSSALRGIVGLARDQPAREIVDQAFEQKLDPKELDRVLSKQV